MRSVAYILVTLTLAGCASHTKQVRAQDIRLPELGDVQYPDPDKVAMKDVPLTGPIVSGAAMLHEHLMAEHAFSGKWHWGTVNASEDVGLATCDGSGDTHAGADLICSVPAWLQGAGNSTGFDTCCHAGGLLDCGYKGTNGYDPNEWWTRLDWPKWDTMAHPRYWVGDMQRALANGLKLIVAMAVENESICAKVDTHIKSHRFRNAGYYCDHGDSYTSVMRQIDEIKKFAHTYSSTFEIANGPAEARAIIGAGKMAVVLGIEADYTWGNERFPIDYVGRLDDYYNAGARLIYLTHKLNGPLAGAPYPSEPQVRVLQSLHNCWYLDQGCTGAPYTFHPMIQVPIMPWGGSLSYSMCPSGNVSTYYQLCDLFAVSLLLTGADGFASYPGYGVASIGETNYADQAYAIKKNLMGLTAAGKVVVQEMMNKGMFIDISHLSEASIADVYNLARANLNYPMSASHALARGILPVTASPIDERTPTSATAEFALSDGSLAVIAATEGIVGHFIAPDPTLSYPSGVANNCLRSDKSLAQSLAYTIDTLTIYSFLLGGARPNVALAGDFMGFGVGVAPRLGYSNHVEDWCGGNTSQQAANTYGAGPWDPHLSYYSTAEAKEAAQFATRGFAHPGLIKQLFHDLSQVGLGERYRHPFEYDGAESTIRVWEKSLHISRKLTDGDGDTILDRVDNCPSRMNPDQLDTDRDGQGDACDDDDDDDLCSDTIDDRPKEDQSIIGVRPVMFCPDSMRYVYSWDGLDSDGDGKRNCSDDDDDDDGIPDTADTCPVKTGGSCAFPLVVCPLEVFWQACTTGCHELLIKIVSLVNPDPGLIVETFRTDGEALVLLADSGPRMEAIEAALLGEVQVVPATSRRRISRKVSIEIWSRDSGGRPGRLVAKVAEYDPARVRRWRQVGKTMLVVSVHKGGGNISVRRAGKTRG